MVIFAADNHYGTRSGAVLHSLLKNDLPIELFDHDWSGFERPGFVQNCELLILNMISGTGHLPAPGADSERNIRRYLEQGGPLLLIHGGSAAFWQWDWWRPIVGYRWVRADDPDGFPPSLHVVRPYRVTVAKSRHPLCRLLKPMDLPEDEIYINMEQTSPATTLMETRTDEGIFVQCYESRTPWNGKVIGFLPGHKPEVVANASLVENVRVLLDYLLAERGKPL